MGTCALFTQEALQDSSLTVGRGHCRITVYTTTRVLATQLQFRSQSMRFGVTTPTPAFPCTHVNPHTHCALLATLCTAMRRCKAA